MPLCVRICVSSYASSRAGCFFVFMCPCPYMCPYMSPYLSLYVPLYVSVCMCPYGAVICVLMYVLIRVSLYVPLYVYLYVSLYMCPSTCVLIHGSLYMGPYTWDQIAPGPTPFPSFPSPRHQPPPSTPDRNHMGGARNKGLVQSIQQSEVPRYRSSNRHPLPRPGCQCSTLTNVRAQAYAAYSFPGPPRHTHLNKPCMVCRSPFLSYADHMRWCSPPTKGSRGQPMHY